MKCKADADFFVRIYAVKRPECGLSISCSLCQSPHLSPLLHF